MSLQLQHLCGPKMKLEADIQHELGRLHKALEDIYSKIYEQISDLSPPSRLTAERALNWLLCSQRQLSSEEFLVAVSADSNDSIRPLTEGQILSICCSLVVFDKALKVFRFAHFSVREYLESRDDYSSAKSHALVAQRCLRCFRKPVGPSVSDDPLQIYAQLYWAVHCEMSGSQRRTGSLEPIFTSFMKRSVHGDTGFNRWSRSAAVHVKSMSWDDPFKPKFESMLSVPTDTFFSCCIFGFEEVIEHLRIYSKDDTQNTNTRGDTGLHLASRYGHHGIIQILLEIGTEINAKSNNGSIALHIAAENGDEVVVRMLLKHGTCVDTRDNSSQTALHYACRVGSKLVSQLLIEAKIPVNAKEENGKTALHLAAERGYESIVDLLLEKGAAVEEVDNEGSSALHGACARGHYGVVSTLLNHGAVVDAKDSSGWTALGLALLKGHEAVADLLLSKGASLPTEVGNWRALHWTVERGSEGITKLLLDNGADPTARDQWGKTPLHRAAWAGHEAVALQLIFQGVDILAEDNSRCTALWYAAEEGHLDIVELLLANGVTAGTKDYNGRTPLHQAAVRGHERVTQVLLDCGADVQAKDDDEKCPLHHAATMGRKEVVRLLLANGAQDMADSHGKSALHCAAEKGHTDVVAQLLEGIMVSGIGNINMQDSFYGMTACHWAAKEGHIEIVKLLIENGADPTLTDYENMMVWDWDFQQGNLEDVRE